VVGDRWQGCGLGTRLLEEILRVARAEGIESLSADILPQNTHMRRICEKFGFSFSAASMNDPIRVHLRLSGAAHQ
jgi:acetyltransferase